MSTRATLSYLEIGNRDYLSFCWHEYDETAKHCKGKYLYGMFEIELRILGKSHELCVRWPLREIMIGLKNIGKK